MRSPFVCVAFFFLFCLCCQLLAPSLLARDAPAVESFSASRGRAGMRAAASTRLRARVRWRVCKRQLALMRNSFVATTFPH